MENKEKRKENQKGIVGIIAGIAIGGGLFASLILLLIGGAALKTASYSPFGRSTTSALGYGGGDENRNQNIGSVIKEGYVRLNVPLVDQGGKRTCGRTSVAMVCNYYKSGTYSKGDTASGGKVNTPNPATNAELPDVSGKEWKQGKVRSGGDGLDKVYKSLEAGNPVIFYQRLYFNGSCDYSRSSYGHIIVITGYDSESKVLYVNSPRENGSVKCEVPISKYTSASNLSHGGQNSNGKIIYSLEQEVYGYGSGPQKKVPYFSQCDSRWGDNPYSKRGWPESTICSGGCGPTSTAMVLKYYGMNVTPEDVAEFSLKNGHRCFYKGELCGTSSTLFSDIAPEYGLESESNIPMDEAYKYLSDGEPLIAHMAGKRCSWKEGCGKFSSGSGHYIVLTDWYPDPSGYSSGIIRINDSRKKENRIKLAGASEVKRCLKGEGLTSIYLSDVLY